VELTTIAQFLLRFIFKLSLKEIVSLLLWDELMKIYVEKDRLNISTNFTMGSKPIYDSWKFMIFNLYIVDRDICGWPWASYVSFTSPKLAFQCVCEDHKYYTERVLCCAIIEQTCILVLVHQVCGGERITPGMRCHWKMRQIWQRRTNVTFRVTTPKLGTRGLGDLEVKTTCGLVCDILITQTSFFFFFSRRE
jgi:hypothetical protein